MSVIVKGMKMPELYETYKVNFAMTNDGKIVMGMCPLNETGYRPVGEVIALPDHHGRIGDLDALKESVLKWLPPDPCGVEEKEYPYETDICVSMLMEIEDAPTIVEAEDET